MILALALSAALQPVEPTVAEPSKPEPTVVEGKVVDCEARHFESKVQINDESGSRQVGLKLCPFKGSTTASWLRTLRDARMKIAGSTEINAADKARLDLELGEAIRQANEAEAAPAKPVASKGKKAD